ncbi:putative membrane protein [Candidatus Ichthyocystis hellenicum]|uniref:Putative membrane protein n=1 Tax=Candidatus Ichthyocystis hellenicum TaxID=1561003 RepID=A0A0S4M375_9BURK|nr:hypothetical protein [Candidatus Ichthyocystis hellenicum]CUT18231.1 putative membrane protein [Candidatus Ichthyocystis hellenicum]
MYSISTIEIFEVLAMVISNVNSFNQVDDEVSNSTECTLSTIDAQSCSSLHCISQDVADDRFVIKWDFRALKKTIIFISKSLMVSSVLGYFIDGVAGQKMVDNVFTDESFDEKFPSVLLSASRVCDFIVLKSNIERIRVDYPMVFEQLGLSDYDVRKELISSFGRDRIVTSSAFSDNELHDSFSRVSYYYNSIRNGLLSQGVYSEDYINFYYSHVDNRGRIHFGGCKDLSNFFVFEEPTKDLVCPSPSISPSVLSKKGAEMISIATVLFFSMLFLLLACFRLKKRIFGGYPSKSIKKDSHRIKDLELVRSSVDYLPSLQMSDMDSGREIVMSSIEIE